MEVAHAVTDVWGADQVGIRFAPTSAAMDIADNDPQATFGYAVEQMSALGLIYIHIIEGQTQGPRDAIPNFSFAELRKNFRGFYMSNNSVTLDLAEQARHENRADLFAFGRPWIANPDLVERLRTGAPLAQDDKATWYGGNEEGVYRLSTARRHSLTLNATVPAIWRGPLRFRCSRPLRSLRAGSQRTTPADLAQRIHDCVQSTEKSSRKSRMSTLHAILIAILQGATELFPVSSLGHAVIVPVAARLEPD